MDKMYEEKDTQYLYFVPYGCWCYQRDYDKDIKPTDLNFSLKT